MLHDPGDDGRLPVADRVHVHLDRVLEELVDQDRMAGGDIEGPDHEPPEALRLVDDLHRAAAQDIGGADQNRVADPLGHADRLFGIHGRVVVGLAEPEAVHDLLETLPVLGAVDRVGGGAQNRRSGRLQAAGKVERRLAAELEDDAHRLLRLQDVEDVLQRHRLEEELVGGVVVGAHRLRVGVDHDALVPLLPQREGGVDAAVVELDPLADPVGAAAEDDRPWASSKGGSRPPFRRWSSSRGCRPRIPRRRCRPACRRGRSRRHSGAGGSPPPERFQRPPRVAVGESQPFRLVEDLRRIRRLLDLLLRLDERPDLVQKPGIDPGELLDFLQGHAVAEGRSDVEEAERIGPRELRGQEFPEAASAFHPGGRGRQVDHQAEPFDLQRTDRLLERLPEGPADRHRLADRFHRRGQEILRLGELLEGPAGNLDDAVIDRRLEGGHGLAGDVVREFRQGCSRRPASPRSWRSEIRSPSRRAPRNGRRGDSSR